MTTRARWRLRGLALVLILLAPILRPDRTLVFRDALPYAAAQNRVLRASLLQGQLPHWDPSQYAGVPFLANPPAQALYPPRLAAVLLTSDPAFANELFVLAHLLLALLGGALLGRELGLGRPARRVVAVTYLLSGPLLSLLENLPSLTGACWLPLSCGLLLRARRDGSIRSLALAAVGLALPLYGGAAQTVTWLALFAVATWVWPGRMPLRARALRLAALGACACLLSAALLLPALMLLPETTRAGLAYEELGLWSFHPLRTAELLIPFPLSLPFPTKARYLGAALEPRGRELWVHTLFMGAIPFLLVVRSLRAVPPRLRGTTTALWVVAAASLLLAFGRHGGPHQLLATHTPYGVFRYPEKHLTLVALALAGLSGVGLQALLRDAAWRRPGPALSGIVPLAAIPLVGVTLAGLLLSSWGTARAVELGKGPPLVGPQLLGVATAQLVFLGLVLAPRPGRRRRRSAAFVFVIVITSLAAMHRLVFAGRADLARAQPPAVEWLRANVPELQGALPPRVVRWPPGKFGRAPADLVPGEAASAVALMTLEGASCALYGLEGLHGMTGFQPRRLDRLLLREDAAANAIGRGAAPFVLGPTGHHRAPPLHALSLGLTLYRMPARPRVELLSGVTWVADDEAAWRALREAELRTVVAVGEGPANAGPATPAGDLEEIERPRPEHVRLTCRAKEPALLVVRDAWFPGWSARVDGRPVEVVRVDGAFMGLRVPAGSSRVELRFRTPGLTAGLLLSALAWLGLLAFFLRRLPAEGEPAADEGLAGRERRVGADPL